MKIVEAELKVQEVALVLRFHLVDQGLRFDAQFLSSQHDWCAVGVVCPNPHCIVAAHALEANPDIGLNVFNHMPQMDGAVGVG